MNITINPEGVVIKDGEEIGTIKGDVCILGKHPGPKAFKIIKEAAGRELTFDILPENPQAEVPAAKTPSTAPAATPPPAPANPVTDPEPKQHPSMGRKDPAWLAWKNRQK
ncbi:hypothetical protein WJU23_05275 [Prosthecobacter sp. SYSU 5D2]|uniref:hypothetical protein n=1 Tax=Prosthecobacter sp. SYSU 5D2 TaxID=3134134 RepID=UPI0031FEB211